MISIANDGQDISSTNYWDTENSNAGFCFLSANAGALRLLVPKVSEGLIAEMRTGTSVSIEKSITNPASCIDIVFEDGSPTPFALTLDRKQMDRGVSHGNGVPFTVWTERGKQLNLLARISAT